VNEAIRQQACLTREKGTAMANIILSSLQNNNAVKPNSRHRIANKNISWKFIFSLTNAFFPAVWYYFMSVANNKIFLKN